MFGGQIIIVALMLYLCAGALTCYVMTDDASDINREALLTVAWPLFVPAMIRALIHPDKEE